MVRLCIGSSLLLAVVPFALGRANKGGTALDLFRNARSVYLTSPSGDEFGMFPLPEDKEALIATRRVIAEGQQLSFVYDRTKADIIVVVRSRATGDTIQVFDGNAPTRCLWHVSGKNGFRMPDAPLAKALETELEKAQDRHENHGNIEEQ